MSNQKMLTQAAKWVLHPFMKQDEKPLLSADFLKSWKGGYPQEIFREGENGYTSFRIPAVVHHNGVFYAFCEARKTSFGDNGAMDIVMRRGIIHTGESGKPCIEWGNFQIVATRKNKRLMNPVPIVDKKTDTILLFFVTFPANVTVPDILRGAPCEQQVFVNTTKDGITWSGLREITKQTIHKMEPRPLVYAPGPGHGVQLISGRLIVPGNYHWKSGKEGNGRANSNCGIIFFSDNGGEKWEVGGNIPPATPEIYPNECQAAELDDGHLYVNSRTLHPAAKRQESHSFDSEGSLQFDKDDMRISQYLEEPGYFVSISKYFTSAETYRGGCHGSILSFDPPANVEKRDGDAKKWVLFSNPGDPDSRVNLSVRLSRDGCKSWSDKLLIYPYPSGYSDLTAYKSTTENNQDGELTFACIYEGGKSHPYERIIFQTLTLDQILRIPSLPDSKSTSKFELVVDDVE